jgi:hypothetical protein
MCCEDGRCMEQAEGSVKLQIWYKQYWTLQYCYHSVIYLAFCFRNINNAREYLRIRFHTRFISVPRSYMRVSIIIFRDCPNPPQYFSTPCHEHTNMETMRTSKKWETIKFDTSYDAISLKMLDYRLFQGQFCENIRKHSMATGQNIFIFAWL